ncbi:MAG: hypothetical protein ACREJX_13125, partial [Polyangiaceae bacterium]
MKSASTESIRQLFLSTSSREVPSPARILAVGIFAAVVLFLASGCTAVADIFKAGVWVGMLGVVALFVLIGGLA